MNIQLYLIILNKALLVTVKNLSIHLQKKKQYNKIYTNYKPTEHYLILMDV